MKGKNMITLARDGERSVHLDTDTARAYVAAGRISHEWDAHLEECAGCKSLVRMLEDCFRGNAPRLFTQGHFLWGDVIHLANWPIDTWVRFSTENLSDPDVRRLFHRTEKLHELHWEDAGLVSDCPLKKCVHRDDIVLASVEPSSEDPRPKGVIFGRLSRYISPTFEELGCPDRSEALSLNFYSVIVDPKYRKQAIGVQLLLAAARHFTFIMPHLRVKTMSPLVGFRAYVARVVGVPILPLVGDELVLTTQQSHEDLGSTTIEPPRIDELLEDRPLGNGRFEAITGISPEAWLQRSCCNPQSMLDDWRRADANQRAAMSALVRALADRYARDTWTQRDDDEPARLTCYVSHLHLRNGASFAGTRAFSRLNDYENLFATVAFEYPTIEPATARRNRDIFVVAQHEHARRPA